MGIYIKNIEMPEDGCHHIICIYADGTVATGRRECRAIPVQPHGRLIDADRLEDRCSRQAREGWHKPTSTTNWGYAYAIFKSDVEDAPTIIPAESDDAK